MLFPQPLYPNLWSLWSNGIIHRDSNGILAIAATVKATVNGIRVNAVPPPQFFPHSVTLIGLAPRPPNLVLSHRSPQNTQKSRLKPTQIIGRTIMFGLGWLEVGLIAVVAAVVFGPKKIPELGSALGKMLRGFKEEMDAEETDMESPNPGDDSFE